MGLAAILILSIIAITTTALSGDSKVEMRHMALAMADSELNTFARAVTLSGSGARSAFWGDSSTDDGSYYDYNGSGTRANAVVQNTEFTFEYRYATLLDGAQTLGNERPSNRLRKVDLTVSWWNGDEGKPGYGQLSVKSTRLIRESDIRPAPGPSAAP